jgi:ADP-ribosylglycohydrolase
MALELADSLIATGHFDCDDVLGRYFAWWRREGFDTGPVVEGTFQRMSRGMTNADAVAECDRALDGYTAGCNPAHRAAPIAMAGTLDDEAVVLAAIADAMLSHANPVAADSSVATVSLCRQLVRGVAWQDALHAIASARSAAVADALLAGLSSPPTDRGGFAPAALRAAVHFVATSEDFHAAVSRAVTFAGPANYCPVIVGAVAGARWGAASIPSADLSHCTSLGRIEVAADKLADTWQSGQAR